MSRKQAAKARPAGRRRAPSPAAGGGGLARQLRALGLKLREVPGDGNCLFRALGDQLEGHSRNHLRHRQETVDYMIKQREEFEPFVEDDVPFEKHDELLNFSWNLLEFRKSVKKDRNEVFSKLQVFKVTNLAKPGTFAGNDAIVAFARNNQINVVIHQLNAPLWQIHTGMGPYLISAYSSCKNLHPSQDRFLTYFVRVVEALRAKLNSQSTNEHVRGTDKNNTRELHIAYRYGEHYDSVRRINDDSEAPAYLQMEMLSKNDANEEEMKPEKSGSEDEIEVEQEAAIQKVCSATGCSDIELVSQVLKVEDYNVDSAIFAILQVKEMEGIGAEEQRDPQSKGQKSSTSALREDNRSGSRIFRNQSLHQDEIENHKGPAKSNEDSQSSKNPKVSKKLKKEQQRLEKKKRQEERHRQKVLANKSNCADNSRREMDSDNQITLVKAMTALNI